MSLLASSLLASALATPERTAELLLLPPEPPTEHYGRSTESTTRTHLPISTADPESEIGSQYEASQCGDWCAVDGGTLRQGDEQFGWDGCKGCKGCAEDEAGGNSVKHPAQACFDSEEGCPTKTCPDLFQGAVESSKNFCSHKSLCPIGDYECVVGTSTGSCDEYPWKTVDVTHCHKWCINRKDDDGLVSPASRVPSTLVVSVASDGAITLVARNIRAQPALDFGIVLHHGQVDPWAPLYYVANHTGNRFYVHKGKMPAGVDPDNHGFIPKLWFQTQVVVTDWIKTYDYVWMVDEDMSFHSGFSYPDFWRRHQEEFPQGPPLVAQPTIRQNTQWEPLLANADVYLCETTAAVTTYVEQQVPIFDAKFWLWLVPRMLSLKLKQIELANDWVTDHVWCRAAGAYNKSRTACAVITTPINHVDSDTSGWRADLEAFMARGIALADWACTVAKHEKKNNSLLGMEWAAYAVSDEPYWPPKATLLIPPLPPDGSEGELPYPSWNEVTEDQTWWTPGQECSVATAARGMAHALRGRRDGKGTRRLPTIRDLQTISA